MTLQKGTLGGGTGISINGLGKGGGGTREGGRGNRVD